jgi:hypothetical protein
MEDATHGTLHFCYGPYIFLFPLILLILLVLLLLLLLL